jgi:hypothetical protein
MTSLTMPLVTIQVAFTANPFDASLGAGLQPGHPSADSGNVAAGRWHYIQRVLRPPSGRRMLASLRDDDCGEVAEFTTTAFD